MRPLLDKIIRLATTCFHRIFNLSNKPSIFRRRVEAQLYDRRRDEMTLDEVEKSGV